MPEIKGIDHLAFRSCIDAIEDVLGKNGKNAVLRYAGLERFIDNPPDYDPGVRVQPNSIVTLFLFAVRDIMGNRGYDTLMFRAAMLAAKNYVKHTEELKLLIEMDIDPVEKIKMGYYGYVAGTGDDPEETIEFNPDKNEVLMHFPYCNECEELIKDETKRKEFKKPACSLVRGLVHAVSDLLNEVSKVSSEEVKCRVLGDDECMFRIKYELR